MEESIMNCKTGVKRKGPGAGFPDTFPCGCACVGIPTQRSTMLILQNGDRVCACGKRWRGVWAEATDGCTTRYLRPSIRHLRALKTLSAGQAMDLKLETNGYRYWVSRLTGEEGETEGVHVERLVDGKWTEHDRYGEAPKIRGRKAKSHG